MKLLFKQQKIVASLLILLLFSFAQCNKKTGNNEETPLVKISYNVDGAPLLFDTLLYHTEAGYSYQIEKLEYILSGLKVKDSKGTMIDFSDSIFYVNAAHAASNEIMLDLPEGTYTDIYFYIGLDSARNISNSLDGLEFENMAWPDMMGGGYHFMKLEGKFLNAGNKSGYAIHLGKNISLVEYHLARPFTVAAEMNTPLKLNMNINEWFKNPDIYDFVTDGTYSMSSDDAMIKLRNNGKDVFN